MSALDTIARAYVECALWSSTDDEGEPLDAVYTIDDLAPEALWSMRDDVSDFLNLILREGLELDELTDEQIGHDFWLTRNGHGAGFWDRGLGELGDRLTELTKPYGESMLYVGDDGRLYVS